MTKIYAKHEPYDNGHLGKVVNDMKCYGSPTIHVVRYKNEFFATNSSHRLCAAHHLGVVPKVVVQETQHHEETNDFWDNVRQNLPKYEFNEVLLLDLSLTKEAKQL